MKYETRSHVAHACDGSVSMSSSHFESTHDSHVALHRAGALMLTTSCLACRYDLKQHLGGGDLHLLLLQNPAPPDTLSMELGYQPSDYDQTYKENALSVKQAVLLMVPASDGEQTETVSDWTVGLPPGTVLTVHVCVRALQAGMQHVCLCAMSHASTSPFAPSKHTICH